MLDFGTYAFKLLLLSLAAGVPVYLLRLPLLRLFSSTESSLIRLGLPFLSMTLIYTFLGLGLLVLVKDTTAAALIGHFRRRGGRGR